MDVDIRTRHLGLDPQLEQHILRRLGFALDRFRGALGRVEVLLAGEGERDLRCRLTLHHRRGGAPTIIESLGESAFAAASHAAGRARHVMGRALQRLRGRRRGPRARRRAR